MSGKRTGGLLDGDDNNDAVDNGSHRSGEDARDSNRRLS